MTNIQLIAIGGFVLAFFLLGLAIFFWRNSLALVEKINALLKEKQQLGITQRDKNDQIKKLKQQVSSADKERRDFEKTTKAQIEKDQKALAQTNEAFEAQQKTLKTLSFQKENFEQQHSSLLEQARKHDDEIKELKSNQQRLIEEHKFSISQLEKKLARQKFEKATLKKDQAKQLSTLEEETKLALSKAKTIDLEEVRNTKFKLKQSIHLFKIAQGQKAMLEERNQNWEKALRLLSTWILKQTKQDDFSIENTGLGVMVAKSLEVTQNEELVIDEFSKPDIQHITQPKIVRASE